MKTFVRHAVMALAIAAACQTLVLAEDFYWVSSDGKAASPAPAEKAAAPAQAPCTNDCQACCEEPCNSCCCNLGCEGCGCRSLVAFAGLDSFKGVSDGEFISNFGAVTGLNGAIPVPGLTDYGINWQLGMSYGIYDLDGRVSGTSSVTPWDSQQQVFVTTGFYHKADCDHRLSYGLVYDWMINNHWGDFGIDPTIGQWRGQIEYAFSGCNSVGFWGTHRDLGSCILGGFDNTAVAPNQEEGEIATIRTRAVNQACLFWHHHFCCGADSYLWTGIPDNGRLSGDGSLGTWMVGANVQVPLTCSLALYANGSYFRPSASAGIDAAIDQGYDVSMGIVWYFGGKARSNSINGQCGTPYMNVANNSTFLVDQDAALLLR